MLHFVQHDSDERLGQTSLRVPSGNPARGEGEDTEEYGGFSAPAEQAVISSPIHPLNAAVKNPGFYRPSLYGQLK
jgi:hypothetical protein